MKYQYGTSGIQSFKFCLAIFIIFATTFLALVIASAADKFCKPGGTGDGSGWASAGGTNLANSLGPGETLWMAGGDYGNGFAITASGNATSPITIKKATAASHGSDSGWTTALDTQAVFNTGVGISGRYVTLDGNEWKPPGLPVKYGILIHHASSTKGVDAGGSQGNITLRDLAIAGPGINGSKAEADGAHIPSNSLISGCAIYDTDALIFAWKGNTGSTIEYSYLYNASSNIVISGNPQDPHPDVVYSGGMFTNGTMRYCVVANVTSEGVFFDRELPGDNMIFYGNIMFQGDCQTGNVPIQLQSGASFGRVFLYHNDFVDFNKSNNLSGGGSTANGGACVNNLFINHLPSWDKGVKNNGFSSTGIGEAQIINAASPFVTTGAFKWVKGSGVPPATRVTTGPPEGYDPIGMEVAFALADNSWAKAKGIAVPTGMNVDLYGNSGNNLGAIQGPPGSGPGPSPTATPAPTATPTPAPTGTPTPVPGGKFKPGDTVTPTAVVNVRSTPSGAVVGTHKPGDAGTVTAGPEMVPLKQDVNWYEINWTTSPATGWSGDDDLAKTAAPSPTPTPVPTATPNPTPGAPTYDKWIQKQNDWTKANPPTPD